jgi:hypothetical protein
MKGTEMAENRGAGEGNRTLVVSLEGSLTFNEINDLARRNIPTTAHFCHIVGTGSA